MRDNERRLAVDPIILDEMRFGILLVASGPRRQRLQRWFDGVRRRVHWLATRNRRDFEASGVEIVDPFS